MKGYKEEIIDKECCNGCDFYNDKSAYYKVCAKKLCKATHREDKKYVIFKKI